MNTSDFGKTFLLTKKKEMAKAKIEQILAPIWGLSEIPSIQNRPYAPSPQAYPHIGGPGVAGCFSGDALHLGWGSPQLRTIPVFVAQLPEVSMVSSAFFTYQGFATAPLPILASSHESAIPLAWGSCAHLPSVTLPAFEFDPQTATTVEAYLDEYFPSLDEAKREKVLVYVSQLLLALRALKKWLQTERKTTRSACSCEANDSNKTTPQVSKRPPPQH